MVKWWQVINFSEIKLQTCYASGNRQIIGVVFFWCHVGIGMAVPTWKWENFMDPELKIIPVDPWESFLVVIVNLSGKLHYKRKSSKANCRVEQLIARASSDIGWCPGRAGHGACVLEQDT